MESGSLIQIADSTADSNNYQFISISYQFLCLLTVHPCIMKPTRCTLFLSTFISTSLHISGNYVTMIRRTYCIYATLVFFAAYGWLSGLLVGMRPQSHPDQNTRQPPSLIPTSRPDSNTVSSQPVDQTATQSHPNQ